MKYKVYVRDKNTDNTLKFYFDTYYFAREFISYIADSGYFITSIYGKFGE